jgi:hypothetical protein
LGNSPGSPLAKVGLGVTLPFRPMKLHDLGPAVPLLIALGFQGWVTYRVWRTRVFERAQKMNQAKLIWLLPVLGAIMVFSVLHQEERAERDGPQLRL